LRLSNVSRNFDLRQPQVDEQPIYDRKFFRRWEEMNLPLLQAEKKFKLKNFPAFVRDLVAYGSSGLKPIHHRAPGQVRQHSAGVLSDCDSRCPSGNVPSGEYPQPLLALVADHRPAH